MVNSQFVGERLEVFSQEAIFVERPDEVFHHLAFVFVEVVFADLVLQFLVERCAARILQFIAVALFVGTLLQIVGHVVGRKVIAHGVGFRSVEFRLFVSIVVGGRSIAVIVVSSVVIGVGIRVVGVVVDRKIVVVFFFEGCIIEHLVLHAVFQFSYRQFHHFGHCYLQRSQLLGLYRRLCLF